jgi:hypothetical protein
MPQYVKELSLIPYIKPYVAAPVKEMEELQKKMADDYDVVASQYDALEELKDNMKVIPWKKDDVLKKEQLIQAASKEIEAAQKAGDYQNRGRLARKAFNNLKTGYAQILSNYEADRKKREELMKFDKIADPLEREKVYNKLSRLYNQVNDNDISYDNKGNIDVRPYQDFNAAADANAVEIADKLASGWKANKSTTFPIKYKTKDGEEMFVQTKLEGATRNANGNIIPEMEQEIFKYIYDNLKTNPELKAYFEQKHLVNNYNLKDFDSEAVALIKSKNPNATDQQIGAVLKEHQLIQEAANFAGKKHGYTTIDYDFKWNPRWETSAKAEAERKAKAATVITTSTSSDYKINIDGLAQVKTHLINQQTDLQKKLASVTDPVVKEELENNLSNVKTKLRLQDELLKNAESKINWNWQSKYADYANKVRKTGEKPLSPKEFNNVVRTGNFEKNEIFPKGGEAVSLSGLYGSKAVDTAKAYYQKYKTALTKANKEGSIIQEHQLVDGNEHTYAGQYSKLLTDRLKNNNVEFITQGGQQLDIEENFAEKGIDLNTLNVIPTKGLIAGKPGFAVTGTKKDGTSRITYYTVMDGNGNIEDYQQNGYDLIEQSKNSKYANSPQKQNQLKTTGLMQVGYSSDEGKKISELNLPIIQGGTREQPTRLPINNKLAVDVITDKGVDIYRLYNINTKQYIKNPEDGKSDFRSEEDLIITLGLNNILLTNPKILQ